MAIGTAKLAHMCLPNSELVIGVRVDDDPRVRACLADPSRAPLLLYPGDAATPLEAFADDTPRTLVVLDGTWPQSKKLLRENPRLASLPRASFVPPAPSEYRIRREPKDNYVSTLESVAYALGVLEQEPAKFTALYAPFRAMIDTQIDHESSRPEPRKKRRRPKKREERLFPELMRAAAEGRLVCLVAEANAWPYKSRKTEPPAPHWPDEVVQILALRLRTNELLDVIVRPSNPLAPHTPTYTHLAPETLSGGMSKDDALLAAGAFFQKGDTIVTWGHYATNLYVRSGGALPGGLICLRTAAKRFVNGPVGTVETFVGERDDTPIPMLGRGRGGRRIGAIAAAVRWLLAPARGATTASEERDGHGPEAPRGAALAEVEGKLPGPHA